MPNQDPESRRDGGVTYSGFRVLCSCNKCGCGNVLLEGQPVGDMCNDCFVHCHRPTSPRAEMRRKAEER
jgi:hypothetical protein